MAQNATTITVPSNAFELAEQGLVVPIQYGWPTPFVNGLLTEAPGIWSPETHWRKTHLDSLSLIRFFVNALVMATIAFFTAHAAHHAQRIARPSFSLGLCLGLVTFVAVYIADKLTFDSWELPLDTFRIKLPISLEPFSMLEEVYWTLELIQWIAIFVTCITLPGWIGGRLAPRNCDDST